jgi:hypothetical protein
MKVVKGPLPVLNLGAASAGTYELSPDMAGQLDQAFRRPFPATDFGERDRFPDWVVVTRIDSASGARWLVREAARAHIWVDVDAQGMATAWRACSRVEARALDRAWGSKFPSALRKRIAEALPKGQPVPSDMARELGKAWLCVEQQADDSSGEALWSLGPPGVMRLRWDAEGRILGADPLTGDAAFEAIRQAAQVTGEWS